MATLWALACLLGALASPPARASVETTLPEECTVFFYMSTPPARLQDPSLKFVCQRYGGRPRYVTLYDPIDRIPIYSAYIFKRSDGQKRIDVTWMFEPQLSTLMSTADMQPFPQGKLHDNFEETQAVLEDYANVVQFERGQLNPDQHQATPDDKAATYTLTNVVPQIREFNIGPWEEHEERIRLRLNNYCRGTAHIVTGVTNSGRMIKRGNTPRLAIPTYMWTAYCCENYDRNGPFDERHKFPVYAAYGLNSKGTNPVIELPVQQLEDFLKTVTFVDKRFQLFANNCGS